MAYFPGYTGQTMYVRTIVDVPAGAQLTICHVQAYDQRSVRQAALLQVWCGYCCFACGLTPASVPCGLLL